MSNTDNINVPEKPIEPTRSLTEELLSRDLNQNISYMSTHVNGEQVQLHRAIMEDQLGHSIPPGYVVHHKDHNTHNNDPSNLVLMTEAEHIQLHKEDRHMAINNKIAVDCYSADGVFVKTYDCIEAVAQDGFVPKSVSACIHNKIKSHYGHIWRCHGDSKPKPFIRAVVSIDPDTGEQVYYASVSEAAEKCGFSGFNLSAFIKGTCRPSNRFYGKVWAYADAMDDPLVAQRLAACKEYDSRNSVPVCAYDTHTGELVAEYANAEVAAKETGISAPNIRDNCKKLVDHAVGYIWRYKSDTEPVKPIYKFVLGTVVATGEHIGVYRSPAAARIIDGYDSKRVSGSCVSGRPYKGIRWSYIALEDIPENLSPENVHKELVYTGHYIK